MGRNAVAALAALLLVAAPAYAQIANPDLPAATNEGGAGPLISVMGKITVIDLAQGTLTLDDGTQIKLPQSFQFTSFPTVGQEVEVTYVNEGGQKVARSIEYDKGGGEGPQ